MLRIPPSQIELTRKEVLDFLDQHEKRRHAQRHLAAGTWAEHQLQWSTSARQPVPRLYRGAERSRDDSLTDSTLVASSPSAAMNDRDEFELDDSDGHRSEAEARYQVPLTDDIDTQSIRRDSAMSQGIRLAVERKPPGPRLPDMMGSLQLDGAPSSKQQDVLDRHGNPRSGRSQRRRSRLRSSSDPGDPLPFSVQRYRPRLPPTRARTTSDMNLIRSDEVNHVPGSSDRRSGLHTTVTDLLHDEFEYEESSRRPTAHHIVYRNQSPLEELATGAARLNLRNSVDTLRRSSSSVTQFPAFEHGSDHSTSTTGRLSVPPIPQSASTHTNASFSSMLDTMITSPTVSLGPNPPSPSAAVRLRAFADSFSPFLRRMSPQRRQERPATMPHQDLSGGPRYSLNPSQDTDWTAAIPNSQTSRPRLTELAIGRSGHSFVASPSRPVRSSTSRRVMLDHEQENNDDMTELEEEARVWRQRMENASMQNDGGTARALEDRTPPRQGRFMRFLGRN